MEYVDAARKSGRPFMPVNLTCTMEENMQRVQSRECQPSGSGKLLDSEDLKAMWTRSTLLYFCDMESFHLDVTQCLPQQAAMVLRDHVISSLHDGVDTYNG